MQIILKNLFYSGLGSVGAFVTGAIFHVLLARSLGTFSYGIYVFGLSFGGLFLQASEFGLSQMVVRDVAGLRLKNPAEYFGATLILRAYVTVGFTLLGFLILVWLNLPQEKFLAALFILLSFGILSLNIGIRWSFQFYQRLEFEGVANFIPPALLLTFSIIAVSYHSPVWVYGLLLGVSFSLGSMYVIWVLLKNFLRPTFHGVHKHLKKLLSDLIPFSVVNIGATIYQNIDVVFISLWLGDHPAGIYGAALRMIFALRLFSMILQQTFLPALSVNVMKRETFIPIFRLGLNLSILVGFLVALALSITSGFLVNILLGEAYQEASAILVLLGWMNLFYFLTVYISNTLFALGKEIPTALATVVTLIINIALFVLLIPTWGLLGAAVARIISEAFLCCILYYLFRKT